MNKIAYALAYAIGVTIGIFIGVARGFRRIGQARRLGYVRKLYRLARPTLSCVLSALLLALAVIGGLELGGV